MNQAEVDGALGTGPPAHGARRPRQGGHWARPEGHHSKRRGLWLLPQNHLQAHPSTCGPVGSFREGAVTVFCASTELYAPEPEEPVLGCRGSEQAPRETAPGSDAAPC